ncbi:hypothetical protein K32_10440 [Kaistia sp. 32K]|uniref:O-antigen ligase family protein n=1 Tax=Kaistia sp. 32K TaxID=2795690 RepID=UPI0019151884|nr:O-antigen ligase family protein [Kaistia sp. 32K]BCP52427.1 hypothetical protein K32_10440 [Kaistia sp. 32K]
MSIELMGLLTMVVGILALLRGETFAFKAFILSTLLGSSAAMILSATGASIQPAHLLLGFLAIGVFSKTANVRAAVLLLRFPGPGFWLLCTWLYGVVGAFFFPRLLAGQYYVNAIGVSASLGGFAQIPLGPTSGNLTQSIYFTGDMVCFLAASVFVQTQAGLKTVTQALLAYCVANILFAGLDLATFWTGTGDLLDFMRNATYTIYLDATSGGMRRIIGSFTEASAFAFATLGAFAFSLQLWLGGVYTKIAFPVALLSLVLLLLSTSTTAYVALPICLALLYAGSIPQLLRKGRPAPWTTGLLIVFAPLVLAAIVCVIALYQPAHDATMDVLNGMVFQKSASQSGIERSRYNVEAFRTFTETLGLGTGIGSVRASSFPLASLANLGVFGSACYALFIATAMLRGDASDDGFTHVARRAAKAGMLAALIASSISGALIDLGMPFFVLSALAAARLHPHDASLGAGGAGQMRQAVDAYPAAAVGS